jgi:hypothetical protein
MQNKSNSACNKSLIIDDIIYHIQIFQTILQ